MIRLTLLMITLASAAQAQTVVTTRTIPARVQITAADLAILPQTTPGTLSDPAQIIGMEARVALYPNRPVTAADIGPPALIERNQIIGLRFRIGNLTITTEGRALDRGAAGELLRVMNLSSRETVTARVGADGMADVAQ